MRIHGEQVYEERVTLWRTADVDAAIRRAEAEAEEYATILEAEYIGLAQAYLLADAVGDGAEVFSLMRTSDLDPDEYIDQFFDTGNERQHSSAQEPNERLG